ncbi:MAG TPA: MoxR family ATPase [Clostridia bacterium]|nr:MoxR family ATPase [Clostridia bacterium]
MELSQIKALGERIKGNITKVIVGKDDIIDLMLISLFCQGHILLEDVPGVGKTMLAKCLAKSINCDFKRIQFTPDLLPTDLTGLNYFNQKQGEFVFRPGPVFSNIVLADEINRATPRTQSSLLECMEERQVTIDGETKELQGPFLVIATQNPVETQGTFPLPEAQLDRFFMKLKMGYPLPAEGKEILDRFQTGSPLPSVQVVAEAAEILEAQAECLSVGINDAVKDYIIQIIEATRKNDRISLGVSPRGSIALMKAAQVRAVFMDRNFVTPDDVKYVAVHVLSHRILIKGQAIFREGKRPSELVIEEILNSVKAPLEDF